MAKNGENDDEDPDVFKMNSRQYLEWKRQQRARNKLQGMVNQSEEQFQTWDDETPNTPAQDQGVFNEAVKDRFGVEFDDVVKNVQNMPDGPDKQKALAAIKAANKALVDGFMSPRNPQKAAKILKDNQEVIKAAQGNSESKCAVIAIVGVGVAAFEAMMIGSGLVDLVSGVVG